MADGSAGKVVDIEVEEVVIEEVVLKSNNRTGGKVEVDTVVVHKLVGFVGKVDIRGLGNV